MDCTLIQGHLIGYHFATARRRRARGGRGAPPRVQGVPAHVPRAQELTSTAARRRSDGAQRGRAASPAGRRRGALPPDPGAARDPVVARGPCRSTRGSPSPPSSRLAAVLAPAVAHARAPRRRRPLGRARRQRPPHRREPAPSTDRRGIPMRYALATAHAPALSSRPAPRPPASAPARRDRALAVVCHARPAPRRAERGAPRSRTRRIHRPARAFHRSGEELRGGPQGAARGLLPRLADRGGPVPRRGGRDARAGRSRDAQVEQAALAVRRGGAAGRSVRRAGGRRQ